MQGLGLAFCIYAFRFIGCIELLRVSVAGSTKERRSDTHNGLVMTSTNVVVLDPVYSGSIYRATQIDFKRILVIL